MAWLKKPLLGAIDREQTAPPTGSEGVRARSPSIALFYCDFFASRLAGRSQSIEVGDQLAGIYIASAGFDELLGYWTDRRGLGRLVANECCLLYPPLFYWLDWIPRDLKRARRVAFWRVRIYHFRRLSAELQKVRLAASELALIATLALEGPV